MQSLNKPRCERHYDINNIPHSSRLGYFTVALKGRKHQKCFYKNFDTGACGNDMHLPLEKECIYYFEQKSIANMMLNSRISPTNSKKEKMGQIRDR